MTSLPADRKLEEKSIGSGELASERYCDEASRDASL